MSKYILCIQPRKETELYKNLYDFWSISSQECKKHNYTNDVLNNPFHVKLSNIFTMNDDELNNLKIDMINIYKNITLKPEISSETYTCTEFDKDNSYTLFLLLKSDVIKDSLNVLHTMYPTIKIIHELKMFLYYKISFDTFLSIDNELLESISDYKWSKINVVLWKITDDMWEEILLL